MEHVFAKVCEVFDIESLNKHQEDAIKYVVEEKKEEGEKRRPEMRLRFAG